MTCYNTGMTPAATTSPSSTDTLLRDVLSEVRKLRKEVSLFVPHDDLREYKNARTITSALTKARARYPKYDGDRN